MIEVRKLQKSFGSVEVLTGLDLSITEGDCIVLRGPNGCGKSTLFRCLLGLIDYDGEIEINGHSPLEEGKAVRQSIGFMPQQCGLHVDMTVEETLHFYSLLRQTAPSISFQLLDRVNLGNKRQLKVGELSGGMRQRLAFVVATFAKPKVLVLDEPIANLDRESQAILLSHLVKLREEKTTILLSTHFGHEQLTFADRELVMEQGRLWEAEELRNFEFDALHTVHGGGPR